MRVRIFIDGVWKNHSELVQHVLGLHRERLLEKMPMLAEKFDFKPPARIDLKPMNPRHHCIITTAGRYWYVPGRGYSILINMPYCFVRRDKGLWVVDHEAAHIAAGIKFEEWGHGKYFKAICKFARGTRCKTCHYCS